MSRQEAINQYELALKAGQKYYKEAVAEGRYPFPTALDDIVDESGIASRVFIGTVDIPIDLIRGTRSLGRTGALAGNFMPLLDEESEFATKWIALCEAHLGETGITDPIKCYEYMGRFYIEEGNKRVSVLSSFGAATISANVTRLVPEFSSAHDVQVYYQFMNFYSLSGVYGVNMNHRGEYAQLQAALGLAPDHKWTDEERLSFRSGFSKFKRVYKAVKTSDVIATTAEALLVWLQVFKFNDIKDFTTEKLRGEITALMPDIRAIDDSDVVELVATPGEKEKGLLTKLFGAGTRDHVKAAFIYPNNPEDSLWSRSHEHGRHYIERKFEGKVDTFAYIAEKDYLSTMETAAKEGADIIFATAPPMIDACRNIALRYPEVKVLNCALSQPYAGVRMYYIRNYESKFITGAIAGTMAENNLVGYVANYPIYGTIASINAFALGVRSTNPRAKVVLKWTCLPGNPTEEFLKEGIRVISNRDATNLKNEHWGEGWGTYKIEDNGEITPLAIPCWNWGKFYEKTIKTLLRGTWLEGPEGRSINYWWGMDSGVIDIQLSDALPDGVKSLALGLKAGITEGFIEPFKTPMTDNQGQGRSDGGQSLDMDDIMRMDWLVSNVDGIIPSFDELLPMSKNLVRILGIYRDSLPPEVDTSEHL